ncbi:unnamed protein product [Lactuca virosa]|uniref:MHD domain-containing protein n=1 Tax=Lactuca virosa TaxID=75947 RepID=A0AAU9NMC6_9ASTR|nr:unnamed protein product [Lactuca virosa]
MTSATRLFKTTVTLITPLQPSPPSLCLPPPDATLPSCSSDRRVSLFHSCYIGMPECKLGLNDRVDNIGGTGRTTRSTRTISFVPPDGAFDVMTYRLSTQVKPLIWVEAQIERHSRSRMEIMVKARSQFKERKFLLQSVGS